MSTDIKAAVSILYAEDDPASGRLVRSIAETEGYAVTVVLVMIEEETLDDAYKHLLAQNVRDIRHLASEEMLPDLCRSHIDRSASYQLA